MHAPRAVAVVRGLEFLEYRSSLHAIPLTLRRIPDDVGERARESLSARLHIRQLLNCREMAHVDGPNDAAAVPATRPGRSGPRPDAFRAPHPGWSGAPPGVR
ncbi:hypothetical protein GCM10010349_05710 [Streptomyces flavofungini]|nr:hypothetical protein GCM10010349_05710 [Streptomyces flavofungini]